MYTTWCQIRGCYSIKCRRCIGATHKNIWWALSKERVHGENPRCHNWWHIVAIFAFFPEILKSYFLISLPICNSEISIFTKIQIVGRNLRKVLWKLWKKYVETLLWLISACSDIKSPITEAPKNTQSTVSFFSFEWNLHILQKSRS